VCRKAVCCARIRRERREWRPRQRRSLAILSLEAATQLANLTFVVAADAYLLAHRCAERSEAAMWLTFCNWSCWNTLFMIIVVCKISRPSAGAITCLELQVRGQTKPEAAIADSGMRAVARIASAFLAQHLLNDCALPPERCPKRCARRSRPVWLRNQEGDVRDMCEK